MVFKIQAFLRFAILDKNLKIQNGRHFWRDKSFLKIGLPSLQSYPLDQKFCRNRSISHGLQDIIIFVFCKVFAFFNIFTTYSLGHTLLHTSRDGSVGPVSWYQSILLK